MSYGAPEYDDINDTFKCEICGSWYAVLLNHVRLKHKMTGNDYRKKFGIMKVTPLASYAVRKRASDNTHFDKSKNIVAWYKREKLKNPNMEYPGFRKGENTKQKYERTAEHKEKLISQFFGSGAQRKGQLVSAKKRRARCDAERKLYGLLPNASNSVLRYHRIKARKKSQESGDKS